MRGCPFRRKSAKKEKGVIKVKEARIDVELFGHAYAPSHLVDGTVKHLAATSHIISHSDWLMKFSLHCLTGWIY